MAFLGGVSGVNYFFSLTTTISPYQRQLLFNSLRRREAPPPGGGRSPPAAPGFRSGEKGFVAVGKWETCFWFSTFPSACFRWSCGNVGISPALGEISKGLWKEGEACLWLSTLSIAPPFPQLFWGFGRWVWRTRARDRDATRRVQSPPTRTSPIDSGFHATSA